MRHHQLNLQDQSHPLHTRHPPYHLFLSAAALSKVPQVHPCSFISFSTVRLQVSFGLPLPLFPSGVQRRAILGSDEGGIWSRCPSHLHLLLLVSRVMGWVNVLLYNVLFLILSGQWMPSICRRHFLWSAFSRFSNPFVVFQDSDP